VLTSGETNSARFVQPQPLCFIEGKPNRHKLSELPYHQTLAASPSQGDALRTTLFNFEFIKTKLDAGMWEQLDEDFVRAASHFSDPCVREFKRWFDRVKGNLRHLPSQALQSALHWPETSVVRKEAEVQQKEKVCDFEVLCFQI
jgi:hypothetical protein